MNTTAQHIIELTIADKLSELFFSKLDNLSKIAKKLGVPGPTFRKVGSVPIKRQKTIESKRVEMLVAASQYVVEYSDLRVDGEHNFIGKIVYDDGGVQVSEVPGFKIDPKYRTRHACDHCKITRKRNTYAMFETSDGQLQVGSTCVKNFIGHDPSALLGWLDELVNLSSPDFYEVDVEGAEVTHPMMLADMDLTIGASIQMIMQYGFRSRRFVESKALTDPSLTTTAQDIGEQLAAHYRCDKDFTLTVQQKYADMVPKFMHWALEQPTTETFWFNVNSALQNKHGLAMRSIPFVAAAVNLWIINTTEKKQPTESNYVGTVGKKLGVTVEVLWKRVFDGAYGSKTLILGQDGVGNKYAIESSTNIFDDVDPKTSITVHGTVKKHEEYKGTKQTTLFRCKLG